MAGDTESQKAAEPSGAATTVQWAAALHAVPEELLSAVFHGEFWTAVATALVRQVCLANARHPRQ